MGQNHSVAVIRYRQSGRESPPTLVYPHMKIIVFNYSKPRISGIRVNRQMYPTYAKIRLMSSKIKGFGTIVPEISSEICEDPIHANPSYARFTVFSSPRRARISQGRVGRETGACAQPRW